MSTDALGDRMKDYESRETGGRFIPMIPVYARLDGISFSRFTKGFDYPYDKRLREAMLVTVRHLVKETQARIGYTQSDEISLCWLSEVYDKPVYFAGKKYKMASALASMATAVFMHTLLSSGDAFLIKAAGRLPCFDARVYQLPNQTECTNTFLWREFDATKNALTMAARSLFTHRQIQGLKTSELHDLLHSKGVNFNDYPVNFKRGTYVQSRFVTKTLTEAEWEKIPEPYRLESREVERRKLVDLDLPPLSQVANRVSVIFDGDDPMGYGPPAVWRRMVNNGAVDMSAMRP